MIQGLGNEVVILVWVYSHTSHHKGWDPWLSSRMTKVVVLGQGMVIMSQRSKSFPSNYIYNPHSHR